MDILGYWVAVSLQCALLLLAPVMLIFWAVSAYLESVSRGRIDLVSKFNAMTRGLCDTAKTLLALAVAVSTAISPIVAAVLLIADLDILLAIGTTAESLSSVLGWATTVGLIAYASHSAIKSMFSVYFKLEALTAKASAEDSPSEDTPTAPAKFEVGQVWLDRRGHENTIASIDTDVVYGVITHTGNSLDCRGVYFRGSESEQDLVRRIS